MKKVTKSRQPSFGLKSPSQLINLKKYNIVHGCVIDSLHVCSGISKQFATMWFGNK